MLVLEPIAKPPMELVEESMVILDTVPLEFLANCWRQVAIVRCCLTVVVQELHAMKVLP